MHKKYLLLIALPLLALIALSVLVYPISIKPLVNTEWANAYAVCEKRIRSLETYQQLVYQRTELNIAFNLPLGGRSRDEHTGLIFFFGGCGKVSCSVYRDSSGWHEDTIWEQGSCLP
jgi:hypothetical protein